MARKKKVVAGTFGDSTYYFNDKGEIVDDSGQPAPPVFAKAIAASGLNAPTPEPAAPEKPAKQPKPPRQRKAKQPPQASLPAPPPVAAVQPPVPETPKQGLGSLNEKVAKREGFFGSALESAAESEYNQKDATVGRSAIASAASKYIGRPLRGAARVARDATSALMATDYVGLGALSPAAFEVYGRARGGRGDRGSRSGGGVVSAGGGSKDAGVGSLEVLTEILNTMKNVSETISNANENIKALNTTLDRQNTDAIDDRRSIRQQNEQIIRLLEIIASGRGNVGGGPGKPEGGGGLLDGLKGALMGLIPGLFKAGRGAFTLAKAGIKGVVGGAKLIGKTALAGAGLAADGVKSLFKGGEKIAEKGAVEATEKGAVKAASTAAEVAAKEAPKAAAATGKAAETILAKEGTEVAAEKGAAKAAGKASIKEIVAKVVGPKVAKTIGKSIPVIGALAGLGFGIARVMEGDFKGAAAEVGGGIASIFPGPGTAASIATDVGLLARDVYKEAYGVFPEDDPLSGERIGEVKKEITNYITGAQQSESKASSQPDYPQPVAGISESDTKHAQIAYEQGFQGNQAFMEKIGKDPFHSGASSFRAGEVAAQKLNTTPAFNTAEGFNAGSTAMALQGAGGASPTIINNNTVNNNGSSEGKGASPSRASGTPRTSALRSHIDRALYGELYGAGIP